MRLRPITSSDCASGNTSSTRAPLARSTSASGVADAAEQRIDRVAAGADRRDDEHGVVAGSRGQRWCRSGRRRPGSAALELDAREHARHRAARCDGAADVDAVIAAPGAELAALSVDGRQQQVAVRPLGIDELVEGVRSTAPRSLSSRRAPSRRFPRRLPRSPPGRRPTSGRSSSGSACRSPCSYSMPSGRSSMCRTTRLVQRVALRDLRSDDRAGGGADDQVGARHVDARLLQPGEQAGLPGDAEHAAAAENECIRYPYEPSFV